MRKNGATLPPTSEPKPTIDVDQVLSLTREPMRDEVGRILRRLRMKDLTDAEVVALAVLIRPIYDRVLASLRPAGPTVLTLVPPADAAVTK